MFHIHSQSGGHTKSIKMYLSSKFYKVASLLSVICALSSSQVLQPCLAIRLSSRSKRGNKNSLGKLMTVMTAATAQGLITPLNTLSSSVKTRAAFGKTTHCCSHIKMNFDDTPSDCSWFDDDCEGEVEEWSYVPIPLDRAGAPAMSSNEDKSSMPHHTDIEQDSQSQDAEQVHSQDDQN